MVVPEKKGIAEASETIMDTEKTSTLTLLLMEGATSYHRWVYEEIKPYLKGNVLEVGCGIGNLTGWFLSRGKVMVSDVNRDYLQTVQDKFRGHSNLIGTALWDMEQEPAEEYFLPIDTIVCSNVLEHIEDDHSVLKRSYRMLRPGGRLILLVPALKFLYNHLDRGLGHFRRYSREELARKLVSNGFEICYLTYFNPFGILGWFLNGTVLRRSILPAGQVRIFNRLVPLFMRIKKVFPVRMGQSLIAVGEKR